MIVTLIARPVTGAHFGSTDGLHADGNRCGVAAAAGRMQHSRPGARVRRALAGIVAQRAALAAAGAVLCRLVALGFRVRPWRDVRRACERARCEGLGSLLVALVLYIDGGVIEPKSFPNARTYGRVGVPARAGARAVEPARGRAPTRNHATTRASGGIESARAPRVGGCGLTHRAVQRGRRPISRVCHSRSLPKCFLSSFAGATPGCSSNL